MHVVTANTGDWIEGTNTEIRVEFDDEATSEAARWSRPGEDMISKCFWRFVHEHWDEVRGACVSFTVGKREVQGLIARLRIANAETVN
jgi:hypothetical protein